MSSCTKAERHGGSYKEPILTICTSTKPVIECAWSSLVIAAPLCLDGPYSLLERVLKTTSQVYVWSTVCGDCTGHVVPGARPCALGTDIMSDAAAMTPPAETTLASDREVQQVLTLTTLWLLNLLLGTAMSMGWDAPTAHRAAVGCGDDKSRRRPETRERG